MGDVTHSKAKQEQAEGFACGGIVRGPVFLMSFPTLAEIVPIAPARISFTQLMADESVVDQVARLKVEGHRS